MLPKLKTPLFDVQIPSTKQDAKFRPFLAKEEKILLMAKQGGSKKEIINAIKQIINNCIVLLDGSDVNVDTLTTFDLEYLFIKLRARSIDNVSKLSYFDHEDEKTYSFDISLDDIEIREQPDHTNKIKVDDEIGLVMKYPSVSDISKIGEDTNDLLLLCIEKIYDADNVYLAKDTPREELVEFIDNLPIPAMNDCENFFNTMPSVYYKIEYTNSKGTVREIELTSLDDFFTFV
jgi:hypothetical protein